MQRSSKEVVLDLLRRREVKAALDAPCGGGWLREGFAAGTALDGIDLYEGAPAGYRNFWRHDLDEGLPGGCGGYDVICCCEGIEHLGNPLRFLRASRQALVAKGLLVVTTPNVWFPQARLQYFFRGFFPSFPPLAGKIRPGTHMHLTPWSFPQLYLFLRLAGFEEVRLVREPLSAPKHFHERLLGWIPAAYCKGRRRKAKSEEEREFWRQAGSPESVLGRHLIVLAGEEEEERNR